ncbi:endo-1,4-beta-xylanase [Humitalea sp. 24SJ18S-53]|uniref:endo-1,4-beta-xylanase n=1 Tax=Humitalea sp. 24SJ18S-53 TaxID=3422307 RepID=UPI003D67234B
MTAGPDGYTGRRVLGGAALAAILSRAAAAQPGTGLGAIARQHGFSYGCAVLGNLLQSNPTYAQAVAIEAGLLVPEYEAKFAALQPQEGRFDFAPLDVILNWAQARSIPVRGHALIWHEALPAWVPPALAEGPARARGIMQAHFDTVLARTRPRIRDWDVVNEAVANPPGSDNPSPSGPLRPTPWLAALGPDYIGMAFRLARERDPTLRLVLNDYGVEEDTPAAEIKRGWLLALCRHLQDQNVPLDAVGIQAHLQMRNAFSAPKFTAFVRNLRAMGLAVLITELDVREPDRVANGYPARDAAVAAWVGNFLGAAIEGGVRTVLTWGLIDRYSWLVTTPGVARRDGLFHRGLPLDWNAQRKPMWRAMARVMGGQV